MTTATVSDQATAPTNPSQQIAAAAASFAAKLKALDCKPSTIIAFDIDGLKYTSTKLPASRGLDLIPRVAALLGAGLARSFATGDMSIDAGSLVHLADRAMRDGLTPLVVDLLARVQCNNLAGTGNGGLVLQRFDDHFAGEYVHLLKVCAFALSHNLRGPTYGVH